MTNIVDVINALPNMLPLQPATGGQITDAELQLEQPFADEYKAYLSAFGAVIADGIELTGITKAEHRNVVLRTQQERALNGKVPRTMYVIENTGVDGIIIWQDKDGSIYQTSPNTNPKKIAASLADYIKRQML